MKYIYTERQGQVLAYIHQYSILNGCAPAEADMQRFFQITLPSVHSMVLTLERRGFIKRVIEFDADEWDRQMAMDSAAGKFDGLAQSAIEAHKAGWS